MKKKPKLKNDTRLLTMLGVGAAAIVAFLVYISV